MYYWFLRRFTRRRWSLTVTRVAPAQSAPIEPRMSVLPPPVPEPAPAPSPPPLPYLPGRPDHLADELARVAALVRAYLLRQKAALLSRARYAQPDGFPPDCGYVIGTGFHLADELADPDCRDAHARQLDGFDTQEAHVVRRLALTCDDDRVQLPVWAVSKTGLVPKLGESVPPYPRPDKSKGNAADPPKAKRRDTVGLDVLLLALLVDRFPEYRAALASVPRSDGLPAGALTAETALRVVQPRAGRHEFRWSVFAPGSALLEQELISLTPTDAPGGGVVAIDPWAADFLLGLDPPAGRGLGLDPDAVAEAHESCPWSGVRAGGPGVGQLRCLSAWWQANRKPLVVLLHGPRGTPFRAAVKAFLTDAANPGNSWKFVTVEARAALRAPDWRATVRRVYRAAELGRRRVLWLGAESVLAADPAAEKWGELIRRAARSPVVTFLASDVGWDAAEAFRGENSYFARVELAAPPPAVRRQVWKEKLRAEGSAIGGESETPAHKAALDAVASFQFTEGQILDALATARALPLTRPPAGEDSRPVTPEILAEACRRQSARRLVSFAQRIQPDAIRLPAGADPRAARRAALRERVVLAPAVARQLDELLDRMADQARVYHGLGFEGRLALGRGLVALFTGPSGTGKTLSATVLAGLLGKDVYKVDAAAVVSKFVGETEKNLGRVFADAQDANAVLFFDEADALFGKRGDVEQAQDRWANLEVNFLLQRVEEYTGTVILATNLRQNIDDAFARRVQVVVEFSKPGPDERLRILAGMFAGTPVQLAAGAGRDRDAVLDPIARRFELTGGNLKNVVLDAVFRAVARAAESDPVVVTPDDLLLGVAREYLKEGRTLSPGVFGRERLAAVERELALDRR
jgi:hypothetical protein